VAVDITAVFDKKIYALAAHESQYFEWLPWIGGYANEVPSAKSEWIPWLTKRQTYPLKPEVVKSLGKWYGAERAAKAKHAEAFEICEYGVQPNDEDIKRLFPMLGK
jgi:LmbE family N-acetylglucosaminyl deacetylase